MRTQQIGVLEMLNVRLAFSLSRSVCASLARFPLQDLEIEPTSFFSGPDGEGPPCSVSQAQWVGVKWRGETTQVLGVFHWGGHRAGVGRTPCRGEEGTAGSKQFISPVFQVSDPSPQHPSGESKSCKE